MAKIFISAVVLLVTSCTGIRSIQLEAPVSAPPGLISGYGVQKLAGNPERARQMAYLKAIDDLLTRTGPVLVTKMVQDQMTVIDVRPASRTLESIFRLRASRVLQPSYERSGIEHGFAWVLLAITEADIERGWQQFVTWRAERVEQAQKLFEEATGPGRAELLKASLSLLEDVGAADDPGLLYYRIKAALDSELSRLAQLEKFQTEFRVLTDNGQLAAAEAALENAQRSGLDQGRYLECIDDLGRRRAAAMQLIATGDDLFREERYKEARARYEDARKIDRDNSLAANKIAMADRYDREARARNVRAAVGFIVPAAAKTLGEYFEFKREEERRKREEERRKREEAERAAEEERNAQPRRRTDRRR